MRKVAILGVVSLIGALAVLGVMTVVSNDGSEKTIGAVATVVAAAGTLITVLLSVLSSRAAAASALSARRTTELALKSEAALELPALRAQKRVWARELAALSDTPYEDRYHRVNMRLDQASARELELQRVLREADAADSDDSFWDDPNVWEN